MSSENAQTTDANDASALAAAERGVQLVREAFQAETTPANAAALLEALIALAGQHDSHGDIDTALARLAEAETLLPSPLPDEEAWQGRTVMLNRFKAGIAQRQGRHEDAVAFLETALRHIPFAPGTGGRGVNSVRLQLLVRLARSRLVLGQAAEVAAEIAQCDTVVESLEGKMPAYALDTIRAAILENHGAALALIGDIDAAGEKFAASLRLIDGVNKPELHDLRQRVIQGWAKALRTAGRAADADALLGRLATAEKPPAAAREHGHHDHVHHHRHGRQSACS